MNSARIHMICGPVAAGKSTYANRLASELNGIVFSIDKWMATLFHADIATTTTVTSMDPAWFSARVDRCEAMIWELCSQVLSAGGVVILDMGFIRRARRDAARERAAGLGMSAQLHYVTADAQTRLERVSCRNQSQGDTFSFSVSPEMFAFAERMFEAPDPSELSAATLCATT